MQHISQELFSFLGTGKESGRQPEQQADTSLSLGTQADKEVSSAQLVTVAEEIAGIWDELASRLSPELFPMRKIKEIERVHSAKLEQCLKGGAKCLGDKLFVDWINNSCVKWVREQWRAKYLVLSWFSLLNLSDI